MRPKLSISASKGASNTAQAASGNSGPRHDNHHVRVPFLHGEQPRRAVQAFRRNQDILAPVLRQDIQTLPARTALYARPGPRLARQARDVPAPAFHLIISDISAHFGLRALARLSVARDHGGSRTAHFRTVIIAMNGPPHDAAALCNSR